MNNETDCGCGKRRLTKNVRFLSAQPATIYYAWQVEVMLNNFKEMGINLNHVDVLGFTEDGKVPEEWDKLRHGYAARFFFYQDTRETKHYISSIRPNIIKQHWKQHPELQNDVIFYHDSDIVFTNPIDFTKFTKDEKWYGSDTKWYISYDYIIRKGEDVFDLMCEVMNIDPQLVIDNNDNAIGAQYLMKNLDYSFWDNVEKDSENLYRRVTALNRRKKKEDPDYHELQIWCADMWSVLWNGWKRGDETEIHTDFNFSWATSRENEWYEHNIFHNAGVTDKTKSLFYKANYMNSLPYNLDLEIKDESASKKYYELIQEVEKKSVLV